MCPSDVTSGGLGGSRAGSQTQLPAAGGGAVGAGQAGGRGQLSSLSGENSEEESEGEVAGAGELFFTHRSQIEKIILRRSFGRSMTNNSLSFQS